MQKKPLPSQVEAIGQVTAVSPDMNITEADHLILLFRDVKPGTLPPPNSPPPSKTAAPANANGKTPEPVANGAKAAPAATADAAKKPRPINLKARSVQAHILREGQRNELEQVWCQGNVRVLQAPEKPGENGVDIRGDTLNLMHHPDGDILTVMGNHAIGSHAQVQMDQLFILGPEIHMDQTRNEVKVVGLGVMRMQSKQSFDGKELAKPSELKVEWEGRMYFDGSQASFFRHVRAYQDTGAMCCEELQVTLDRHVSLKEGGKGDQPAVEKLVCHNQVGLEDTTMEGNKIVALKRISAPELAVDNDKDTKERSVHASGPGSVRIFQLSAKDDAFDSPKKPDPKGVPAKTPTQGAPAEEKEFKLTKIWYVRARCSRR